MCQAIKSKARIGKLYIEHKKWDILTVACNFILDKIYPNEYVNLKNGKKTYQDKLSDETSCYVSVIMWGYFKLFYSTKNSSHIFPKRLSIFSN
jgi:hypothetical protein